MEFLYIDAFFLLILPLILFIHLLLKKQNSFESHFSKEILEKITISSNLMSKNIKNCLLLFSLVLMILALARPVIDQKEHKVKEELIPIIIAIDVSKSMLANDIYPNRLALAKQKLLKVLQISQHNAVGVVLFAKSAFVLSPITQDFTSLTFLVKNLDNNLNFDNGSNMLSMLEASNDLLEDYNSKNIILLSDGGNKKEYEKEISFAKENKIKVYSIGIALDKQTPIPTKDGYMTDANGKIVTVGLNKSISNLGLKSDGGYIDFSLDSSDVKAILKDIESEAKKEQMNSTKIKTYTELFYYPLGLALFLLLLNYSSFSFKKNKNLILFLLISNFYLQNSHADILDFKTLDDAQEAYQNKKFNEAESLYKKIDKNPHSTYNIGNSLYNQAKYKEAQEAYESIKTDDKDLKYKSLHNLGNSHVKQRKLEKAKKAYEDALKIKDDEATKQNLDTVNKALKKKKKQDDKNKKKNKKDDKNKDNKGDKQDKKDKESKKKKQDGKDSKKDEKQKPKEKNSKDKKSQNQKKKEASEQEKPKQQETQKIISDMEEKKWLNQLNNQKNKTFLRKYESKSNDENVKNPW